MIAQQKTILAAIDRTERHIEEMRSRKASKDENINKGRKFLLELETKTVETLREVYYENVGVKR